MSVSKLKQRHMEALQAGIGSLRADEGSTDVEILIKHRIFRCHKAVLIAMSPYFRAMFSSAMKESKQKRIKLQDIDEIPFEKFLEFVYKGTLELQDMEDSVEMLRIAALFQVDILQDHCEESLLEQLKVDNCVELFQLSCLYNCKDLKKKSWQGILDGFCSVWKSEDFLSLSVEEVTAIFKEDNLVTLDEEHVCDAALKWVNFDLEKRKQHVYELFKHVRLPHVSPEYLVNYLCKVPCLREDAGCRRLLEEAQQHHLLPARQLDFSGVRTHYRIDDDLEEVLLAITENNEERGSYIQSGWCLWAYSFNQRKWFTLTPIPQSDSPGHQFAICSHGYNIYLSGGTNNPKSLLKFESERNEWVVSSGQLKKGRCQHSMVALGNAVYCLGGNNTRLPKNNQTMGSIEEYHIPSQKWKTVGEFTHPVHSAAAAVCGEQILLFGGTGKDGEPVSWVQCFHTRMKETSVVSNLPYIPRRLFTAMLGEDIYILSENEDGNNVLKLTPEFGFTDAGFDIPAEGNILGTSQHDENLLMLMENPNADGRRTQIVKIILKNSQIESLSPKGNGCPKPIHACNRCYVDKRFLYHTYFQ